MADGGRPSFDALLRRYAGLISRVVSKVAGVKAAADLDDIEQKVAVSLWQRLAGEQRVDHPSSYVYRAAVREAVRWLKARSRREEVSLDAAAGVAQEGVDPHARAASGQSARLVEAALGRLQPERAIAVRAHLLGFSVEEIMELNGWPYQKARNLIARGMTDLRSLLATSEIDG